MKGLIIIILFLFSLNYNYAQISFAVSFGRSFGTPQELDQYLSFKPGELTDGKFTSDPIIGLTGKYYFTDLFYSGLVLEYYNIKTDRFKEIIIEDYSNLHTEIAYVALERERIQSSLLLGYHLYKGVFVEIGGVYLYNHKNNLEGSKGIWVGSQFEVIDLVDFQYKMSENFGFTAGLGFKLRLNKGLYFITEYKYLFEEPTTFSNDSKFMLGYNSYFFSFGIGYDFKIK